MGGTAWSSGGGPEADRPPPPPGARARERPSLTAEVVALLRAREQLRPPAARLIEDPWALPFLQASRSPLVRGPRGIAGPVPAAIERLMDLPPLGAAAFVPLRHRIMDEHLERAVAGGIRQIAILGAGLDARPYRLRSPAGSEPLRFFEVDHPSVSAIKQGIVARVVGEVPHVRFVAVDLERQPLEQPLLAAGLEPRQRSAFVWEGVTYYLEEQAIRATLGALARLGAPGSLLLLDGRWRLGLRRPWSALLLLGGRVLLRALGEPLRFAFGPPASPTEPRALLAAAGWELGVLHEHAELARRLAQARGARARLEPMWFVLAAERPPAGAG
ncbi:MAG: hypothetical protein KatS3mg102_1258 [Planctomycetota bacterium]|nr:MAG: hypothetical protein KatS3mg102_1258 [Planctomycetota bacterium]